MSINFTSYERKNRLNKYLKSYREDYGRKWMQTRSEEENRARELEERNEMREFEHKKEVYKEVQGGLNHTIRRAIELMLRLD